VYSCKLIILFSCCFLALAGFQSNLATFPPMDSPEATCNENISQVNHLFHPTVTFFTIFYQAIPTCWVSHRSIGCLKKKIQTYWFLHERDVVDYCSGCTFAPVFQYFLKNQWLKNSKCTVCNISLIYQRFLTKLNDWRWNESNQHQYLHKICKQSKIIIHYIW
jgi:hypothetical protein